MADEFDLPEMFREHDEASYTARQLEPTLQRLQSAANDVETSPVSAQALAAAWTRIAELRLPRKAVPGQVLHEIEDLVIAWDSHGIGGIAAHAYWLGESEREIEAQRIRDMLKLTEDAAADAPAVELYDSE